MSNVLLKTSPFPTLQKKKFVLPSGMKLKGQAYEAAATGRRMGTWGTSSAGPNSAGLSSLPTIRARSREIIRNNPFGLKAKRAYVTNMVGTGIKPRWKLKGVSEAIKEELHELWEDWTDEADATGTTDFYGMQASAAESQYESGEVFVRMRPRRPEDGLSVPLQLQMIESDFVDVNLNSTLNNGNTIQMGIEYNQVGQRVAYHMFRAHPGDSSPLSNAKNRFGTVRVPASDILHIYKADRPGQIRGIPELSTVLVRLHELDQYEDAELVRKKVAAMFAGFITRDAADTADTNPFTGTDEGEDDNGIDITGLEPGMLQELEDGQQITFSQPADVGGNLEPWLKNMLRSIASGANCTYEQLTGDLSSVNFSSLRAGLIEFRRYIEMLQWSLLIFQFCRPVANRWIEQAVLSGAIPLAEYRSNKRKFHRVDWQPQAWAYVKPLEDAMTAAIEIRNGVNSRNKVCAAKGYDVEEIDRENAEDNARADGAGLVYDTDPRNTNKSGTAQKAEDAIATESLTEQVS